LKLLYDTLAQINFTNQKQGFNFLVMKKLIVLFIVLLQCLFFSVAQQNDSIIIKIINCGDSINTTNPEYAPVIAADGSIMMFTSKRPTGKSKKLYEKFWFTNFDTLSKIWKKAQILPDAINFSSSNTSIIALSNDAQKMLLYKDNDMGTGDIYESQLKGDEWTDVVKLPEPINTKYHESSASYSPDGRTIYFISERPEGKGKRDIWFCTKSMDGAWGKAENMGENINTPNDEEGVFFHPDGKTLYFSSDKKGGNGGYDIYKTTFINNSWSVPQNMNKPINTEGDDVFFVIEANNKVAYYSSDQKGTIGEQDIFKITFEYKIKPKAQLTLLKGIITDEKTNLPVEATIEVYDNEQQKIIATYTSNSATGKYLISLPEGKNYGLNVSAKGYLFQSKNINITDSVKYGEINEDIKMKKIEVGKSVVLNNVFFDYNKSSLREESKSELQKLINMLDENLTIKLEISGHTDNKGNADYNQKLSEDRAKAVVSYLIVNGIPIEQVTYKGYGLSQPIATNDTEEGRQLNRRTEFKILKK